MQFPTEPGGLGHEGWGVIDALGEGVSALALGDRVAALTYHAYATHDIADADRVVRLPSDWTVNPFFPRAARLRHEHFRALRDRGRADVAIVGGGFSARSSPSLHPRRRTGHRHFQACLFPRYRKAHGGCGGDRDGRSLADHRAVKALTAGRFCERVIERSASPGRSISPPS